MAAVPPGLMSAVSALARQGRSYDEPDSPTNLYFGFLAEIEVVSGTKTESAKWSAQFEIVPVEWMQTAVLSQPESLKAPPPPPPYSFLVFEEATPKEIAEALGTTPDDVAEADWFLIELAVAGRAARRLIPPRTTTVSRLRARGTKLRGPVATKLAKRFKPRGKFSAKAMTALLATFVPREIGVMDVGQGSCNLVYDAAGAPQFYVDVGLPMFFNFASLPPVDGAGNVAIINPGPCLQNNPPVVVTHWHWDHYWMAIFSNNWAALRNRQWIVSGQPAGPAVLALLGGINASANGNVSVFPAGLAHLGGGYVTIIQCVPGAGVAAADVNNTGIAVIVRINDAMQYDALLPGDSAFQSIPGLAGFPGLRWMPATHHGSDTNLFPPGASPIPAPHAANQGRLAYSYGINGAPGVGAHCYGHPAALAVAAYPASGWGVAPLVQSTAETGPNSGVAGRGNIMMANNVVPPPCPTPNCPFHVFPKTLV